MPTGIDVQLVLDAKAVNGERPGWDDVRRRLYWVDMRLPALHVLEPASGHHQCWEMPGWIGTFAILEDGLLAVALRTGLHLFDADEGSLALLAPAPYDPRRFCFNDGRCDRQGRLIIGPLYNPLSPGDPRPSYPRHAPLWRFDGMGRMEALPLPPVKMSNGLAFSPDGRTLYHSDTSIKTIWACDYDPATGGGETQRGSAQGEGGGDSGGPDGATVDRDGFYICAVFGGGHLLRFDPTGKLERRIDLPEQYPTMPALGGPGRSTLYFTTASYPVAADERADHPHAGGLFALEAPAPGLPTSYMAAPKEPHA